MYKIIGGEFQIEEKLLQKPNNEKSNIIFSSGRHALATILQNQKVTYKTILVPDYLCDSITRTIKDIGWNYEFYHINEDLLFNAEDIINREKVDAILVINYFGMINLDKIIEDIHEKSNLVIIEDDVQAFYQYKKSKADYSFTSLRKWFPCPDGAFVNSQKMFETNTNNVSKWSQYKFAGNILKNYSDDIDDSICLNLLEKGEQLLDEEYLSICSKASQTIFSNINLDEVAYKRKINAKCLHENLLKLKISHIYNEDTIPLFIPIFVENRNKLRTLLFKNNIFTPVHWPKVCDEINGGNDIYEKELSLICDQRYDVDDMERQINVIKQFLDCED